MKPDFEKSQLIPAVVQNISTLEVLMLGYMNREAFEQTQQTGKVWFYSRSKQRLWMKGETSGNVLNVVEMRLDCDGDALLVLAKPEGPTCHTEARSCFGTGSWLYSDSPRRGFGVGFLGSLFDLIQKRKNDLPEGSYTSELFRAGLPKILEKVEEESEEVVRAAREESGERLAEEVGDLLYHLFVMLAQREVDLKAVIDVLERRNNCR